MWFMFTLLLLHNAQLIYSNISKRLANICSEGRIQGGGEGQPPTLDFKKRGKRKKKEIEGENYQKKVLAKI